MVSKTSTRVCYLQHSCDTATVLASAGLAAGFDKDAEVIRPMLGIGFGFVEVGEWTSSRQLSGCTD